MKILKIIVVVLFFIFGGLAVAGLFMPAEWRVERSQDIDARPGVVFEFVSTAQGWDEWTSWAKETDPSWKMTVVSPSAKGAGTVMKWSSIKFGAHTVKLTSVDEPNAVTYDMQIEQREVELKGKIDIVGSGDGSTVTWAETGDIGSNPYMRLLASAMRGMVEGDFDKGLAHLKKIAEAKETSVQAAEEMKSAEDEAIRALQQLPDGALIEAMKRGR